MLTVEEALARCLEAAIPVRTEKVAITAAYGRVLAEDVAAAEPAPRWDNSAMDGFAVRAADTVGAEPSKADCDAPRTEPLRGVVLRVLETIAAGSMPTKRLEPGTCARIMTGAPMPEGADAVVMREYTTEVGEGRVRIGQTARPGQHVRRAGEEIAPGQVVLKRGQVLTPARVGLCAAVGRTSVIVARRPRVALVSTGDEVVPPGEPLGPGQIWSSNTHALAAFVEQAGGEPIDCGIAPDTREGTREVFRRALDAEPDVLVSTGGVSVGDFDVVKEVLGDVGADMRFWKVRMKPGMPLAFGVIGGRPAFGLPGNPVSCVVNFLQFVRPLIRRALGDPRPFLPVLRARLTEAVSGRPGRAELVRVALEWTGEGLLARPTGPQGSHRITSVAEAHGFALLGAERAGAAAGDTVPVQIFDTGFLAAAEPDYTWGGRPA